MNWKYYLGTFVLQNLDFFLKNQYLEAHLQMEKFLLCYVNSILVQFFPPPPTQKMNPSILTGRISYNCFGQLKEMMKMNLHLEVSLLLIVVLLTYQRRKNKKIKQSSSP
ncbi:unnamed protein product [Ilex paraguariensis]|uniref:Uncharacterized protein n=1 Tax=Ilex paraguariensis TaxID=185542 RepID=A0ABC8R2R4_9AQUA